VIEVSRRAIVCDAGVVRSVKEEPPDMARRLKTLYDGICEVLDEWQPQVMVVEQLYAHYDHPRTAILMGHARGTFFLAGAQRGIPVLSYAATKVKKLITGSGRAGKEQDAARDHPRTRARQVARTTTTWADALAIALSHYFASRGTLGGSKAATFHRY